ncbi:hypothetical protein [Streptomyces graminilatus]|uniref:hypothetical protein n=1 Tax=Streptomyces graminilatus TaxID=1464070 RepID=UPI000AD30E5E|nr:hypothetical protein [Streptomyces graminilatus]
MRRLRRWQRMVLAAVVGIIAGYTYRLATGEFGGPWSWTMLGITLVTTMVMRSLHERIARGR